MYSTTHQSQCADIGYLLTWAEGEIWMMQKTSGCDSNRILSRVVTVVLSVVVGSAFPLMQLMQRLHPVPPSTGAHTGQQPTTKRYDNGVLIRNVLDTATLGTCRDHPVGRIDFVELKGSLFLSVPSGSHNQVHLAANDQNGRMGNSCKRCHGSFPSAFVCVPERRTKPRRARPKRKPRGSQDPSTGAPAGAPTDEPMHGPHDSAVAAA